MCKVEDCFLIETGYWINKQNKVFKRNEIIPKAFENIIRTKRNNTGIFKTAYSYNSTNQNESFLYGDFYLDFDSEDFEKVREDVIISLSYIKIVFKISNIEEVCDIFYSGNKGMHIILPAKLLGIEPNKKLNETFKVMAKAISEYTKNKTLDLRIYDCKRMFRIANSIHESTNRYKIYLTLSEVREMSHEDIKNLAASPRAIPKKDIRLCNEANKMYLVFQERAKTIVDKFKNVKSSGTLTYTPPCIAYILENGAKSGARNNTIAILSSFHNATGKDLDETVSEIKKWNIEKNSVPVSNRELIQTCRSIYSSDSQFGCSSIKSLNLCSNDKCNFRKRE